MLFPNKRAVLDALIAILAATLRHATEAAEEIRRSAVHEEARPENDKDTRALEQTYLARGQAMRAEELTEQVQLLRAMPLTIVTDGDVIRAGALVALEDEAGESRCVFLAPYGGGEKLTVDGATVVVVTPTSALGRSLLGKRLGDDVDVSTRGSVRTYSIVDVS